MRPHPEIVKDIESVLKDKVAPSVAAHNGEIKFISFHQFPHNGVARAMSHITAQNRQNTKNKK